MSVITAIIVGGVVGWLAGPFLSRANPTVQLAARIAEEEAEGLGEQTLESEAFRETGKPLSELYDEARRIEGRFATGGMLFGVWCAAVIGLKLVALNRIPRQNTYEIDHATCMACAPFTITIPTSASNMST